MIHYTETNNFKLGVKEMGAELTSFQSKTSDFEFIWSGNTDIWYGQSPILFPIIGRLLDDKYTLNGKEYEMPKHGIVRKKPFALIDKTENSLTFRQSDDEESIKAYPFSFDLDVKFTITDNGLKVDHTVHNKNNSIMYYSFGAHPAFNCNIGDYFEFETDEVLETERIDHESILIDEKFPVEINDRKLVITNNLFDNDALILSGYNSKSITLKSNNNSREIKFNFDSPLLGIWAKPGAPYVCIEPWWGVNDSYHKVNDFSQKREVMELAAGESKTFTWSIEIIE